MAGEGFDIETTGLPELSKKLAERYARMRNPRAILGALAVAGEREIVKNFKAGGRPVKWKPSKRANRPGQSQSGQSRKGQTLRDSDALMDSIKGVADETTATVGVMDERVKKYARAHDKGVKFRHSGGTPYYTREDGLVVFMRKDGSYPKGVQYTKPHDIVIPQRQFLVFGPSSIKVLVTLVDRMIAMDEGVGGPQ